MKNDDIQMSGFSDEELFSRLKDNDEPAFSEIYKRYWDCLYYFSVKKINQFEDSENIIQEIFMDLWNRRKDIEIKSSLGVYLFAAVKYKIINYLARKDRQDEFRESMLNMDQSNSSTEDWLSFEELRHLLEKRIDLLPEKCKLIYRMRENGYSYKQIASTMHISEKTVENHIARAMKLIKNGLSHLISFFL